LETRQSPQLKKNVYQGHWRHLGRHHPYRKTCATFNGKLKPRPALTQMFATNFLARTEEGVEWLNMKSMWP
jgi:hypothetical protein